MTKIQCLFFAMLMGIISQAQTLPVVTTVLGNTSKTLLSNIGTDIKRLKLSNTGLVPLRFCMNATTGGTCPITAPGITVNAGTTVATTVGDLGGISIGTKLNVTNTSTLLAGAASVIDWSILDPCPGCQFVCLSCPPPSFNCSIPADAWHQTAVLNQNSSTPDTLYLCPGSYSFVDMYQAPRVRMNLLDLTRINAGMVSTSQINIGTTHTDDGPIHYALNVNGNVRANKINVYTGWADYVFKKNHKLKSLEELEQFINENGHLPEIPAEEEITQKGADVGEILKLQMAKIEELSLYIIAQEKKIKEIESKLQEIQKQ